MSIENLLQNFANATGIIVDRTFSPPRILGQAFLVSKSRMVTCAGCVFNYTEAPWALAIKFPHPDVTLGVKTMALHPEFDRKESRAAYLSQTASSKYTYNVQLNDLATMVIQNELKEPDLELAAQLHRALSLPFSSDGVNASGAISGSEFEQVVKQILGSQQPGLITLFDELNIPIAYIQIAEGMIERVYFQGISGEMGFAELIYRQPARGFSFRPNENFSWGDLRKVTIPTPDLIAESIKRAQQLPSMLSSLGGTEARFQKVVKEFNSQNFNQNVQWLVNNLWQAIDGYLTIDQLSERVGADTFTVAQGLRELSNQGVVSLINRQTPFHMNGQLGTPIVSHTDFDINPGDSLKAFYLDPLSGSPCWQEGDFAGVASVLQPKNLLHSIPIRIRVPGALILKNYKLIGVHNGATPTKPGQPKGERPLYQMMWIGALFDMTSKKLRTDSEAGEGTEVDPSVSGSKVAVLRERRGDEEKSTVTDKPQAYICPNCFANNAQLGNCFNCGTVIDVQPEAPKKEGFFRTTLRIQAISDLQEKYMLSDKQIFAAAGGCVFLFLVLIMMISAGNSGPSTQSVPMTTNNNKNAEQSVQLAVNVVGFKGIAPPGYSFSDTSSLTAPLPSFALVSESSNQRVLFVIFDDMSPVQALDRFTQIPPFCDVIVSPHQLDRGEPLIGSQILGDDKFNYFVKNYLTSTNTTKSILVGSFAAKEKGKGVLVIGQGLKEDKENHYDYKSTLFLVDTMAESFTAAGNSKRLSTGVEGSANTKGSASTQPEQTNNKSGSESGGAKQSTVATEEEIDKYCQSLQEKLQKKTDADFSLKEEVKKRKNGKVLKVVLQISIDSEGNLTKMELAEPDKRQKTNDDLVRVLNSCTPLANVPKTESGTLDLRIMFKNGTLTVERDD